MPDLRQVRACGARRGRERRRAALGPGTRTRTTVQPLRPAGQASRPFCAARRRRVAAEPPVPPQSRRSVVRRGRRAMPCVDDDRDARRRRDRERRAASSGSQTQSPGYQPMRRTQRRRSDATASAQRGQAQAALDAVLGGARARGAAARARPLGGQQRRLAVSQAGGQPRYRPSTGRVCGAMTVSSDAARLVERRGAGRSWGRSASRGRPARRTRSAAPRGRARAGRRSRRAACRSRGSPPHFSASRSSPELTPAVHLDQQAAEVLQPLAARLERARGARGASRPGFGRRGVIPSSPAAAKERRHAPRVYSRPRRPV